MYYTIAMASHRPSKLTIYMSQKTKEQNNIVKLLAYILFVINHSLIDIYLKYYHFKMAS